MLILICPFRNLPSFKHRLSTSPKRCSYISFNKKINKQILIFDKLQFKIKKFLICFFCILLLHVNFFYWLPPNCQAEVSLITLHPPALKGAGKMSRLFSRSITLRDLNEVNHCLVASDKRNAN